MSLRIRLRTIGSSVSAKAQQLYSPKELRALLLFLGVGVAVLLYRGGKELYSRVWPDTVPRARAEARHKTDSLFFALSAKAKRQDSLIFALSEDSLNQSVSRKASTVQKGANIPEHSIALNHASREELLKLPTVGPVSADLILQYRKSRGGFRTITELMSVHGIGERRLEKMKPYLKLE